MKATKVVIPQKNGKVKTYYKVQLPMSDGKRKAIYGKTKAEAQKKAREHLATHPPPKNGCETRTVESYSLEWLARKEKVVRAATYTGYASKVRNYIIPALGDKLLTDVTADDIEDVLGLVAELSASSYRLVHMLLCQIFRAAKRNHYIDNDPTVGISGKGGKPSQKRPALTDDQVDRLLQAIKGLLVETFILIAIYTGMRREEILGLQWDCVHLDAPAPYIEVHRALRFVHNRPEVSDELKSPDGRPNPAARRDIPIPSQLVAHLQQIKTISKGEHVVCNRNGGPLSETQYRNMWDTVYTRSTTVRTYTRYDGKGNKTVHTVVPQLGAQAAHNPTVIYSLDFHVTAHQLRYTYITNLIHKGMDPKSVQYLAGHEDIKITLDIYARVKYNRPEDLADPINKVFSGENASEQMS